MCGRYKQTSPSGALAGIFGIEQTLECHAAGIVAPVSATEVRMLEVIHGSTTSAARAETAVSTPFAAKSIEKSRVDSRDAVGCGDEGPRRLGGGGGRAGLSPDGVTAVRRRIRPSTSPSRPSSPR